MIREALGYYQNGDLRLYLAWEGHSHSAVNKSHSCDKEHERELLG
jgi:hypothetical protein